MLVRPPEAAANAITKAMRPTAACDILPTARRSHRIMYGKFSVTVHYLVYTYLTVGNFCGSNFLSFGAQTIFYDVP